MPKYNEKNLGKLALQYVLAAYGAFYTLVPHAIHQKYAPDWFIAMRSGAEGFAHTVHVTLGLIMLAVFIWITFVKKE